MGGGGGGTALPHSWPGSDEHTALQLAAGAGEPARSRADAATQRVDSEGLLQEESKRRVFREESSGAELGSRAQEEGPGVQLR